MNISSDSQSSSEEENGPHQRPGTAKRALKEQKRQGGGNFSDSDSSMGSDARPLNLARDPTVKGGLSSKKKGRRSSVESVESAESLKLKPNKPVGMGANTTGGKNFNADLLKPLQKAPAAHERPKSSLFVDPLEALEREQAAARQRLKADVASVKSGTGWLRGGKENPGADVAEIARRSRKGEVEIVMSGSDDDDDDDGSERKGGGSDSTDSIDDLARRAKEFAERKRLGHEQKQSSGGKPNGGGGSSGGGGTVQGAFKHVQGGGMGARPGTAMKIKDDMSESSEATTGTESSGSVMEDAPAPLVARPKTSKAAKQTAAQRLAEMRQQQGRGGGKPKVMKMSSDSEDDQTKDDGRDSDTSGDSSSEQDQEYPDRPPSPGTIAPMPKGVPPPPKPGAASPWTDQPEPKSRKDPPQKGSKDGPKGRNDGRGGVGYVSPNSTENSESDSDTTASSRTEIFRKPRATEPYIHTGDTPRQVPKQEPKTTMAPRKTKDGKPLPSITPDSSEIDDSSEAGSVSTRGSSLDWTRKLSNDPKQGKGQGGSGGMGGKDKGRGPARFGRDGKPLPDITPDSTEDEGSMASGSRGGGIEHPNMPIGTGARRDPRNGRPLPDITPDSSIHDGDESELSGMSGRNDDMSSRGGRGAGGVGGHDEEMPSDEVPGLKNLPEGGHGGDGAAMYAGDSARGAKVSDEEEKHWMPLSARLEMADKPDFRWEDFNMSGLPKYVVDAGGRKKFLRLKTEADFRAALRRNPNDLPVLHRYGLLLYNKKKDIPNAELMFQRILEKAPDYTEALLDYGCLLWNRYRMADKDRKKKDDLIRAERMLRKCVKIIQNNNCVHARAFSKLALFIDSMLHDKEESLEYFKLAAKAAPDDADHAFNLASHLEDTKDMEGAVKWYKKAIEIDLLHAPSLSNYGRLLETHFNDKENASTFHARAIKAAPYDCEICFNYALHMEDSKEDAKRNFDFAREFYDRAVQSKPKGPDIYLGAAQFYLRRKRDFVKTMELHKQALRQDPFHIPSLLSYARFLEYDRKDPKNAGNFYERAVAAGKEAGPENIDPNDHAEALMEAARFTHERGRDPDKASEIFRKSVETMPTNAQMLSTAANFFHRINHDDLEGRKIFEQALHQLPATGDKKAKQDRYEVLISYARFLHDDVGNIEEAGGHLRECIQIDSGDSRAIGFYARILHEFYKDVGLSDRYFRQAIKLDVTNMEAILGYAKFQEDGRKNEGMADYYYKMAIKADSSHGEALSSYARFLHEKKKDYPGALKHFKMAVERCYEDAELHVDFADFLVNDYPEYRELSAGGGWEDSKKLAEEQYCQAIECSPREPTYYVQLAIFLSESKRKKEAYKLFQQALSMDESNPDTLGNYATFLESKMKDHDGAEQMFLRAIRAEKRNPVYLYNYALFLQDRRKNYAMADDYFQRALEVDPKDKEMNLSYADFLRRKLKKKKLAQTYYARAKGKFGEGESKGLMAGSDDGSSSGSYETDSDDEDGDGGSESDSSSVVSSDATSSVASGSTGRSSVSSLGPPEPGGNRKRGIERMIARARKEAEEKKAAKSGDGKDCTIS